MSDPSQEKKQRPTLDDVAKELGVSKSTVSLALRDNPRVHPETRRKIWKTARELNYQPDPLLSAYARRRRNRELGHNHSTIGVIWPTRERYELWPSTLQQVQELGYTLDHFYLREHASHGKLASVLEARGIMALLIPDHSDQTAMAGFPWEKFAAVQCGVGRYELPVPIVRYDSFATMKLTWQKLRAHGCRRIGAVLARHAHSQSLLDEKSLAACNHMRAQSNPSTEVSIEPLVGSVNEVRRVFLKWKERNQPDVVIGPWSGFFDLFKEHLTPREGFAGFAALRAEPGGFTAGCSVHRQDLERIAINHLDAMIRQRERWHESQPRLSMVLKPIWQPGQSLGPLS